jgi:hypothetical protein
MSNCQFPGRAEFDSHCREDAETTHAVLAQLSALRSPRDVQEAYNRFGATCGPCAFAALLGKEVAEIIHLFPQFPEKQHTNIPSMKSALKRHGFRFEGTENFPSIGLTLISGPEKYYSRHWLAVRQGCVYDVNFEMWMPTVLWCRDVLPAIARADRWVREEWHIVQSLVVVPESESEDALTTHRARWFL